MMTVTTDDDVCEYRMTHFLFWVGTMHVFSKNRPYCSGTTDHHVDVFYLRIKISAACLISSGLNSGPHLCTLIYLTDKCHTNIRPPYRGWASHHDIYSYALAMVKIVITILLILHEYPVRGRHGRFTHCILVQVMDCSVCSNTSQCCSSYTRVFLIIDHDVADDGCVRHYVTVLVVLHHYCIWGRAALCIMAFHAVK